MVRRSWFILTVLVLMPRPAPALTSNNVWQNASLPEETTIFTVEAEITPNGDSLDGVVGLCLGEADHYEDLAAIWRFNSLGTIDVRDGDVYRADASITYTAGMSYEVRAHIDIPNHTYSVWVTPAGETETAVATNYAFRTPHQSVSALDGWATVTSAGTMEVELTVRAIDEFTGVHAAGCQTGEYYDLQAEQCQQPEEQQGCAAVSPGFFMWALMGLPFVRRRPR